LKRKQGVVNVLKRCVMNRLNQGDPQ